MKQILVYHAVDPEGLARLRALPGIDVQVIESPREQRELPAELLRGQHVLFCKLPPRNFEDFQSLELVQLATAGYEHLRDLKLGDRPFRFCNARGIFDMAIAEWTIAMMINLVRDLRGMIRNQEHGVWERADRFQYEVRGKTVGFWGYGGIGRETARLAKTLGMRIHVCVRRGVGPRRDAYTIPGTGDPEGALPDRVFTAGQEMEFLADLDFLVLSLPLTAKSRGLIGEKELQALPRTAFVLNPARGPIIQEESLLAALRGDRIAGAALDTHYVYPLPADHPLWRFPNVILTPHISGADHSQNFLPRIWDLFVQNVERYLTGKPLLNQVSTEQLREV
jgi:phosphoglycerate dehydrogenase-like enzyme